MGLLTPRDVPRAVAEPKKKWKMEDDLKKMKMEDNLNFKAVLMSLFNNKNLKNKWFWHHRDWPSYL